MKLLEKFLVAFEKDEGFEDNVKHACHYNVEWIQELLIIDYSNNQL